MLARLSRLAPKALSLGIYAALIRRHKVRRHGSANLFDSVLIETNSYCNRSCAICPNSISSRATESLSQQTFSRIIDELATLGYDGRIGLHGQNEPLFDPRLPGFIAEIRRRCPEATIVANSNGDYLNADLARSLREAGLNRLVVSCYDDKSHQRIQGLLPTLDPDSRDMLSVRLFYADPEKNDAVGNWAGSLAFNQIAEPLDADCARPSHQLVINYKGEVVLCCIDYHRKEVMGDAASDSLVELWNGPGFSDVRRKLRDGERACIELCSDCDQAPGFQWAAQDGLENYANARFMQRAKRLLAPLDALWRGPGEPGPA